MKKRIICFLLVVVMLMGMLPATAFAAHDSTGRPLDLTGDVYLALYIGGSGFPGEPAEHDVSGYLNLNSSFASPGFTKFAESAENILEDAILDDVVQGTSGVWGVFSITGGSHYLLPSSGLVTGQAGDAAKPHNAETEKKIIQTAIDAGEFTIPAGKTIDNYTIIWYVIKYQRSDSAWHIDGVITEKQTYTVNYYGNGNTSGGAPTGANNIMPGTEYTIAGNTGNLQKRVGNDVYLFNGWNTAVDGTGEHYEPGQEIEVNEDLTLYAQWHLQNRYTVTAVTKLDDLETNIEEIHGQNLSVWIKVPGEDEYLELSKSITGTYTTTVTENGVYSLYFKDEAGNLHQAHNHSIVIYNENGRTELLNYSVSYDPNAGEDAVTWTQGDAPAKQIYHATESAFATTNEPRREGYTFLHWEDQDGNIVYPDQMITGSITKKTVLTAQWEKNIDVTVNITVNHMANGVLNPDLAVEKVLFNLLKHVDGVDMPVEGVDKDQLLGQESTDWNYTYNEAEGITTYTHTFKNLPQGVYTAIATKSHYTTQVERIDESDGSQTVNIQLDFAPESFDLDFQVKVNFTEETKELMPQAVNVRILTWTGTAWELIEPFREGTAPITVFIDENGYGDDYYPVPKGGTDRTLYCYRIAVSSFVMPDGSIVPASGNNFVDYTPNGSGLYTAKVTVEGTTSHEHAGLNSASYKEGVTNEQEGIPTATVDIQPFIVTFQAGEDGTVEGQQTLTYTNQYRYPDLNKYTAVPNKEDLFFIGWFTQDDQPAENKNGQYLTEDVTYYAKYSTGLTVEGNVIVDTTYEVDGEITTVNEIDQLEEVLVVLEKLVGDNAVDMEAQFVTITYDEFGTGSYRFEKVPNDGSQYRIRVFAKNYATTYDNESDPEENSFTQTEFDAVLDGDEVAEVNVHLDFQPVSYEQYMEVDASQIGEGFRPSSVLAEVLYRDVGDIHHYNLISQHKVAPFGEPISLSGEGMGSGSYDVWQYHTNGSLYEYQMNISMLYGNVDGVFTMDGVTYNSDTAPFTIEYAPASHYSAADGGQARTLKATLIPKEYEITFDLNLGEEGGEVSGMDQYLTDSETGESYIYHHTWSERAEFDAYPYRPGYVFEGWECANNGVSIVNGGYVVVGAELAEDLVLVAQWKEITDNAYVVRHLELNTDKPLKRAVVTEGDVNGSIISANECVATIEGYQYAGAMVDGKLYTTEENATMTVKAGQENIMIIYYLPDGSDGYTEQVESNLKLDKTATLENDGTYTVTMETFTKDNPITTLIQQNTPLDIVLVLDQSGSLAENEKAGLNALQNAVNTFVTAIADHGRHNEVDHRIAVVGYASNETDGTTSTNADDNPYTGGVVSSEWTNTGVFDSNGKFHLYNVKGFTYQEYEGSVESDGIYYTKSSAHKDAYLLLTYHEEYYHLITEDEARLAVLNGETVYGYVYDDNNIGSFVELTRNSSGLWLYGDKQLYSLSEFFTYHTDVWTHRHGLERREIHAYGTGSNYKETDGHTGVYTRTETTGTTYDLSVYADALIPVSVGANGSGGVNPGLIKSSKSLGANGGTRASYGMEMANAIFEANEADDRVRIVVMFTDGKPGQSGFLEEEANAAIAEAYISKNEYDAYVYTIGLYSSNGVDATSDIAYYMNALSSNYPDADDMGDIKQEAGYVQAADGQALNDGVTRYVKQNNNYYTLKYGRIWASYSYSECWYFTSGSYWSTNTRVTTEAAPVITGGKVGNYEIYEYQPAGYKPTEHSGYYSTTDSTAHLVEYFTNVMKDITTKITQEIVLHEDTILRDIMGEGLVLRPGSVVTAYKVAGTYNPETKEVEWEKIPGDEQKENRVQVAQVTIPENPGEKVASPQTTTIDHYQPDGSVIQETNVPFITVYNLNAGNPTDPDDLNYHPHTVDITGYDFENWYISEEHPNGFKMVVEITGIEATDDVQWGRSTSTNNEQSGLWLPKDAEGNRQLLLPFRQPTTIFVERAYVLDYGKEFTLSGWYFDDEDGKNATPIHVDCDIESGMNQFDSAAPNLTNQIGGAYGNTTYGNVQIDKDTGKVTYNPTSMNWGGYDQFYVFGQTWRKTVLAQTANNNGVPEDENLANLWNKVTVIPANNIYYEDSFITTEATTQNGIQGFKFTGTWTTEGTGGSNVEIPEHLESAPNGDVHGWTDSLSDDITFSDGSAHVTGLNKELGAQAEFTFTGTGVEVYSHTDANTGMIVAVLRQKVVGEDGVETNPVYRSLAMDGLAMSGGENGYYHIPTVAFKDLPYGTYSLQLIATAAASADGTKRYVYYLDGVRIHNPLGNTTNYQSGIVKEAYELENNAVYTEVRDILLDNGSFNADKEEIGGAVFIDWIQSGQGDEVGVGTKTYDVGTFKEYGPKNEVYLSAGQAIVIKVKEGNNYYVGLKSLTGGTVKANLSGVDTTKDVTSIEISHTTDMYYRVNPMNGYIVIQNGNTTEGQILSITNLRTTNMNAPAVDGGVDYVTPKAAVMMMRAFDQRMIDLENAPPEEEIKTPAQQQAEANIQFANTMFPSVRQWLSE